MSGSGEDLSVDTIIIVAAICGTIVFILLSILIFLCCRREQAKYKDRDHSMLHHQSNNLNMSTQPVMQPAGFDNPVQDTTDTPQKNLHIHYEGDIHTTNIQYTNNNIRIPEPAQHNESRGGRPQSNSSQLSSVPSSDVSKSQYDPTKPKKIIYEVVV